MKIKEMAIEAAAKINEDRCGSYVRGFSDGAKAIIKEIESLIDRDNWLEAHRISVWRALQRLKEGQS